MCAAFPIGWVVSHALMAAIYYLVITPMAVAMRLLGRDPLDRRFDRDATTYWVRASKSPIHRATSASIDRRETRPHAAHR